MTGFPGFLGSALLPRLLARREGMTAICLIQPHLLDLAERRLAELEAAQPHIASRVSLVVGDITTPGLGVDRPDRPKLRDITEVWHLAAVYDLSVSEAIARQVNVEGTAQVLDLCRTLPALDRLQYVSTCYVAGDYDGEFPEDDLDLGQGFLNHYESTKFEAEVLVRRAMRADLPTTIYRPGIVVGDSRTGETQKYDGPYFVATYLRRQPKVALVPAVGPVDRTRMGLVPRDYVIDSMDNLSVMDRSIGRTYALTDPNPPTARHLVETFAKLMDKRVVWVSLPLGITRAVVGTVPWLESLLGLPAEALDYLASRTSHSTANALADLAGTGVVCASFDDYAGRLLDFMIAHPEFDASAMV